MEFGYGVKHRKALGLRTTFIDIGSGDAYAA